MGTGWNVVKGLLIFGGYIPLWWLLFVIHGFYTDFSDIPATFTESFVLIFVNPELYLERVLGITYPPLLPTEEQLPGAMQFLVVILFLPALSLIATLWYIKSSVGAFFARCPVCYKMAGVSSNHIAYKIVSGTKQERLYVHHGCFVEGAKEVGHRAVSDSHITVTTRIGRKKFKYSMHGRSGGFGLPIRSYTPAEHKDTIKFFRDYMRDDNVWFLRYGELDGTAGEGIYRLAHIKDAYRDLRSVMKDTAYRSGTDRARNSYEHDMRRRGKDKDQKFSITLNYITSTAMVV